MYILLDNGAEGIAPGVAVDSATLVSVHPVCEPNSATTAFLSSLPSCVAVGNIYVVEAIDADSVSDDCSASCLAVPRLVATVLCALNSLQLVEVAVETVFAQNPLLVVLTCVSVTRPCKIPYLRPLKICTQLGKDRVRPNSNMSMTKVMGS